MTVQQYSLVAHDWLNLEFIINDLASRVIGQDLGTGSSPTFADLTLTSPSNIYALSHDSFADVHQDVNTDASPTFAGMTMTGTLDASAGKVLVTDNGTVAPTNVSDGYIGVALVSGEARIYFKVENGLYYVSNDGISVAPVTGNPLGLLLSLTYT